MNLGTYDRTTGLTRYTARMNDRSREAPRSAAEYVPARRTRASLLKAAAVCQGCDLYRNATQTVFGEGEIGAALFFIGEQPGDSEDRVGHPFVGPAGRLLNESLAATGLARGGAYVTNAVKHFKWQPRGKRRMHKAPDEVEIRACAPWLVEELALVRPRVVVCLGVTAARAAFGGPVRIKDLRGTFTASALFPVTFVTVHPAAILRVVDAVARHRERDRFLADLERLRAWLAAHA